MFAKHRDSYATVHCGGYPGKSAPRHSYTRYTKVRVHITIPVKAWMRVEDVTTINYRGRETNGRGEHFHSRELPLPTEIDNSARQTPRHRAQNGTVGFTLVGSATTDLISKDAICLNAQQTLVSKQ